MSDFVVRYQRVGVRQFKKQMHINIYRVKKTPMMQSIRKRKVHLTPGAMRTAERGKGNGKLAEERRGKITVQI